MSCLLDFRYRRSACPTQADLCRHRATNKSQAICCARYRLIPAFAPVTAQLFLNVLRIPLPAILQTFIDPLLSLHRDLRSTLVTVPFDGSCEGTLLLFAMIGRKLHG